MKIEKIWTVCFSATGNTSRVTALLGKTLAERWQVPVEEVPFTKPEERSRTYAFRETDLVLVGSPTYAGKLPNKILPSFREQLRGNGALAVAVVTFGNRAYDNALAELCAVLERGGFRTAAAGAFVGRHAFTDELAYGRPGWSDEFEIKNFTKSIADKVDRLTGDPEPLRVSGDPDAPYYVPKGEDGAPVNFLKAKPKTRLSKCNHCGACARLCPMGAIDLKDVSKVPGTCIKCQRCVRKCTKGAKYFDDEAFLSHVRMLEHSCKEPKENEIFL